MGATVTTGRRASAFRAQDGKIIYVAYEQHYEKNVHPHTPHWSVIALGEISGVLQRIFAYASSCEGGMLQNRSGWISPEGYLRSWMKELESPIEQRDVTAKMEFSASLYATLNVENKDKIATALADIGKAALFDSIVAGERPELSLHKDTNTVLALYGVNRVMPAWSFFGSQSNPSEYADRNATLGYNPKAARISVFPADPVVLRLPNYGNGDFTHLIQNDDGTYTESGWAYSIVGDFVEGLWKDEMDFPGHFYSRIRGFRSRVKALSSVALEQFRIVVDATEPVTDKWDEQTICEFREKFRVSETATGFEIVPTMESLNDCTRLPRTRTRWIYTPTDELGTSLRPPVQERIFAGDEA